MSGGSRDRLCAAADAMGVLLAPDDAKWLVALLRDMAAQPQNLTAVCDEHDGVDRHLADALSALVLPLPDGPACDIGSGGGIPGLVLARVRPGVPHTLIEAEGRKAEWLRRASGRMPNVRVLHARTEDVATRQREAFALVTARAVAPPIPTLELAAPLVSRGGSLVVWTARDSAEAWDDAGAAAETLGFGVPAVTDVSPFADARRRLLRFEKHLRTPGTYPRRPGRATKRPLATGRHRAA